MREVLRDHPLNAGELIMPPGHAELRRQIAKRMAIAGAPADPAHVVITGGTMDAITLTLRVCVSPGDTVLVESPTYFGLLQAIEHLGLKVVEVPNHPGAGIDVDAVRSDRSQHEARRGRADAELQQSGGHADARRSQARNRRRF